MDLDSLSKAFGLVSAVITTLKGVKDLLPPGDRRTDAEQGLKEAENNLRIAEAAMAKEFNYQLCHRHFPPGILLDIEEFKSKCNTCGHIVDYNE